MANGTTSNNGAKIAGIAIVALAVGLGGGYLLGKNSSPAGTDAKTYEEGYAAAKQKMEDAGLVPREMPEVRELSGEVVSVEASSFTFKPDGQAVNPLAGAPETRTVIVSSGTTITMEVPKPDDVYAKEVAEFNAALAKLGDHPDGSKPYPPAPTANEIKEVSLKDLKQGATVRVTASEDVKMAPTFTAVSVFIYGGLAGSGPPPRMPVPAPDERTSTAPSGAVQPDEGHPPAAPQPNVAP